MEHNLYKNMVEIVIQILVTIVSFVLEKMVSIRNQHVQFIQKLMHAILLMHH